MNDKKKIYINSYKTGKIFKIKTKSQHFLCKVLIVAQIAAHK